MTDWSEPVRRGVESDTLDYKAAMDWNELPRSGKAKLVRHALALANTRGGDIVIGVGEDAAGHPSDFQGLTDRQAASFDPTPVIGFINRYADPPIDLELIRPLVDGKRYAILHVRPFTGLPHVCPNGVEGELQTGVFYIRTPGASSRPAATAAELHGLVQRALRNQREQLGRLLRGLLYENKMVPEAPLNRIAAEIRDAREYFLHRRPPRGAEQSRALELEAVFAPEVSPEREFDLSTLRTAMTAAAAETGAIPPEDLAAGYLTNFVWRSLPEGAERMWQLGRDGVFLHFDRRIDLPDVLDESEFAERFARLTGFLGNLYAKLGFEDTMLDLTLRLGNTANRTLRTPGGASGVCRIPEIVLKLDRTGADWLVAPAEHAARLIKSLSERFNLP